MSTLDLRHEAEIRCLERTLRQFGVLTRERLAELSGADCWPAIDSFKAALDEGIRHERLRALGDDLVELGPRSPD